MSCMLSPLSDYVRARDPTRCVPLRLYSTQDRVHARAEQHTLPATAVMPRGLVAASTHPPSRQPCTRPNPLRASPSIFHARSRTRTSRAAHTTSHSSSGWGLVAASTYPPSRRPCTTHPLRTSHSAFHARSHTRTSEQSSTYCQPANANFARHDRCTMAVALAVAHAFRELPRHTPSVGGV